MSFVVLVAASSTCSDFSYCKGRFGYAVAAGVISFLLCGWFLLMERKGVLGDQPRMAVVVFLCIWWVLLACLTTFGELNNAPFIIPGNGYFAAWGGCIVSILMLSHEVGKVRDTIEKMQKVGNRIGILLVASLVVLFAGAADCDHGCTGLEGYAIAVGCISFMCGLVLVFAGPKLGDNAKKFFGMFMIVWWSVAVIILTFVNPFKFVGNGFFGTWAAFISTVLLFTAHNSSTPPSQA
ncbi:Uncharacterized protein SCF082_LOCUS47771 [Durusdinium trenchii]|uniref:Uncharacterized protein n=1 Tax=Durusdinium trenchii TaxID=1381693 RepID=A0ABP0RPD0_9DINO